MRARLRSRCRLAQIFSTAAWSSGLTGRQAAERSAAMATERASSGSFLLTAPVASSRTRAASLGCTSSTRSPAATSCRASRCPRPAAPSTAQVRSGQDFAQVSSRSACAAQARTRPTGTSSAPIATAVCEPLCGSTPIITAAIIYSFPSALRQAGPRRGCLIPERPGVAPSYEPRRGKIPAGRHVVRKPGHDRPAADMRARPAGTSGRHDPNRNAWHRFFNKADIACHAIVRLSLSVTKC